MKTLNVLWVVFGFSFSANAEEWTQYENGAGLKAESLQESYSKASALVGIDGVSFHVSAGKWNSENIEITENQIRDFLRQVSSPEESPWKIYTFNRAQAYDIQKEIKSLFETPITFSVAYTSSKVSEETYKELASRLVRAMMPAVVSHEVFTLSSISKDYGGALMVVYSWYTKEILAAELRFSRSK